MLRLFVAILVPEEVVRLVEASQGRLRSSLKDALTWTRPEHFHLTLAFLGSVDPLCLDALQTALANACSQFDPFPLEARGCGFFPHERRARVVWTGLHGAEDTLVRLHREVATAARRFTKEELEKRFHAHITLGRVKGAGKEEAQALARWQKEEGERSFGGWMAREAALMRSQLSPKGAAYTKICALPFA